MKEFTSTHPLFWDTDYTSNDPGHAGVDMHDQSSNVQIPLPTTLEGEALHTWDTRNIDESPTTNVSPVDHHYLSKGDIKVTANIQTRYTKTHTAKLTTTTTHTRVNTVEKLKDTLQKAANLKATIRANIARLEGEISNAQQSA